MLDAVGHRKQEDTAKHFFYIKNPLDRLMEELMSEGSIESQYF